MAKKKKRRSKQNVPKYIPYTLGILIAGGLATYLLYRKKKTTEGITQVRSLLPGIPKEQGESDTEYLQRLQAMAKEKIAEIQKLI